MNPALEYLIGFGPVVGSAILGALLIVSTLAARRMHRKGGR